MSDKDKMAKYRTEIQQVSQLHLLLALFSRYLFDTPNKKEMDF